MKLEFKLVNLKTQEITSTKEAFVELLEKSFLYRVSFRSRVLRNPDDEALGWKEEEPSYFEVTGLKSHVCGCEFSLADGDKWVVAIIVSGFGNDLKIYFDKPLAAEKFYSKIQEWVLS